MKKALSAILAVSLLVSAVALTACGDDSDKNNTAPKNSSSTPSGSGAPSQTSGSNAAQTTPGSAAPGSENPGTTDSGTGLLPSLPDANIEYHAWEEVENLETFKSENTNLYEEFFDAISPNNKNGEDGLSYHDGAIYEDDPSVPEDVRGTSEQADSLFDMNSATKWGCANSQVEYLSAVVWSMTQAVNVTGYTMTTANDNTSYPYRNPLKWRLYGANELPNVKMTEIDESTGMSYFDSNTVPAGWTLIDAVDATDPSDESGMTSLIPDQDYTEVGSLVANPGSYKYFMLLIDETEHGGNEFFQLADFTLYGKID